MPGSQPTDTDGIKSAATETENQTEPVAAPKNDGASASPEEDTSGIVCTATF